MQNSIHIFYKMPPLSSEVSKAILEEVKVVEYD